MLYIRPDGVHEFDQAAYTVSVTALLLVLALGLRAWAHTAVSFSIGESLAWEHLRLIAWESQWGEAWKLQVAGALTLTAIAWGTAGNTGSFSWTVTGLASLAVCFLLPLLGHAAGEPVHVLVHGSHIAGAGAWIGTLIVMAVTLRGVERDTMLRAFAPIAFAGSAVIGVTGRLGPRGIRPLRLASSSAVTAITLFLVWLVFVHVFKMRLPQGLVFELFGPAE